jgi:hypothetical protein
MRLLHFAFCAALVSSLAMTPAFARGGGGGGGSRGGGGGARGGGGFSGGARGGGGGIAGRGSIGGFGGARGGFGYGGGRYIGGYGYRGWGLGFGWGYPYYGWGYPYAYGYPYYGYCDPYYYNCGYAPYDYGYSYAPQASGPAVINQYIPQGAPQYAPQGSPQYTPQSYPQNTQNYALPQPAPTPRSVGTQPFYRTPDFYLIAFTDHTMQAALSFNVEGDTIHYTTREHVERTAPLSSVDVRFSQQINRDRHVDFKMPQGRASDLKVALQ